MRVLVTGGAGYIGSHAVKRLLDGRHDVVVVDNLCRGHRAAVLESVPFYELDTRDTQGIQKLLVEESIECVMHFAAFTYVNESVSDPLAYYHNNTAGTISLLRAVQAARIQRLVFSSTAATYGEPESLPLTEDTPTIPINPYGWSKLLAEQVLSDYATANKDFAFASLRYFNVAGCDMDGRLGEDHDPETHLIPLVLFTALGKRETITIFGDDYATPDGTCIRDYIHVDDLVDAHVVVMDALQPGDRRFYNLGIGRGLSVKEIIHAAKKVTGIDFPLRMGPRRPGDPAILYACVDKITRELGWRARITGTREIIASAWNWFKKHPHGYREPEQLK